MTDELQLIAFSASNEAAEIAANQHSQRSVLQSMLRASMVVSEAQTAARKAIRRRRIVEFWTRHAPGRIDKLASKLGTNYQAWPDDGSEIFGISSTIPSSSENQIESVQLKQLQTDEDQLRQPFHAQPLLPVILRMAPEEPLPKSMSQFDFMEYVGSEIDMFDDVWWKKVRPAEDDEEETDDDESDVDDEDEMEEDEWVDEEDSEEEQDL
jgi:hypothetical protein